MTNVYQSALQQQFKGGVAPDPLGTPRLPQEGVPGLGTTMPGGGTGTGYTPPAGGTATGAATGTASRTGFGGMSLDAVEQKGGAGFRGFNDSRALAGDDPKSVKDAFRRVVGGLGLNLDGLSKQEVGNLLRSQVLPALQAAGVQARMSDDAYDVMDFNTAERGWMPLDVVYNAGGPGAAFHWEELGGDPAMGGGGAMGGGAMGGGMGMGAGGGQSALMQQILQSLQEQIYGGQPTTDQQALLLAQMSGGR